MDGFGLLIFIEQCTDLCRSNMKAMGMLVRFVCLEKRYMWMVLGCLIFIRQCTDLYLCVCNISY